MLLTLLDRFLPRYDFSERHQLWITATPEKAYQAFKQLDFSESKLLKILLFLRGIRSSKSLSSMFTTLIDQPPDAFIQGLIGKPWTFAGELVKFDPAQFQNFSSSDTAKMLWGFFFIAKDEGCLVITETRIQCTDASSRSKFRMYWCLIRPFSGLVRMIILQMLKKKVAATG